MKKSNWNTHTLTALALLCAVDIVLGRFCVIYITSSIKITFEAIPILLAGILFGPVGGALVGAGADILGSAFLSGYGWTPALTVTPILLGVLPGLMRPLMLKKPNFLRTFAICFPGFVLGSMGWTTWFLSFMYGSEFFALAAVRIPLYCVIGALDCFAVYVVCRSGALQRIGFAHLFPKKEATL